jgi:ribosomal protein S6--L-glutamate ligase
MKIAILSRDSKLYSTHRLYEAALARGHEVVVIDYLRCYINIATKKPKVIFGGKALDDIDAVIPRIGATHTFYGAAVVRQFEMMGKYSLNRSQAILRSRDKLRSLQIMAERGIHLPTTGCAHSTKDIDGLIGIAGGAPVVIKLLEGTQGIGVVLAETKKAAESVIEAFRGLREHIIVQEFIKESNGTDIRCFVVGDKVVAAMMRKGAKGEFRSNLHRGGVGLKVKISPQERATAVKAAQAMGLKVAGVDILRSNHGPLVMEVNSSPGLKGIETTTGLDVADRIIEFIEKNAKNGNMKDKKP